ncbi:hypothetical protein D9M68_709290 [compost metagenome]
MLATLVSLCSFRVTTLSAPVVLSLPVIAVRFSVMPSMAVETLLLPLLTVMPLISISESAAAVCCVNCAPEPEL